MIGLLWMGEITSRTKKSSEWLGQQIPVDLVQSGWSLNVTPSNQERKQGYVSLPHSLTTIL